MAKAPKTALAKVPLSKAKATPKKGGADAKTKGKTCPACNRPY